MEQYLIRSTICLAALYGFYYFFLANEKMHLFNRFYLLFSVVLSSIIPLIYIKTPIAITSNVWENKEFELNNVTMDNTLVSSSTIEVFDVIFWIYIFITIILTIKFIYNLSKILLLTISNERIRYQNATILLLEIEQIPFSFLNYIFINKERYDNDEIEEDILIHELAHTQQLHSLDIIFIELISVIFWFNPLMYLIKNAIQLNHEYLADESVIQTSIELTSYQELILEKVSKNNPLHLSSNFNYSLTKKRFIMMTKTTTASQFMIRTFLILPLTTFLLFSCSKQSTAQSNELSKADLDQYKSLVEELYPANKRIYKYNKEKYEKLNELYYNMSNDQKIAVQSYKEQIIPVPPTPPAPPENPVPPAPPVNSEPPAPPVNPEPLVPPTPPTAPIPPNYTNNNSNIAPPPPPPLTKKQMISFIDSDVNFYLNNEKIDGKEILDYFNNNEDIQLNYNYVLDNRNKKKISEIKFYTK